MRKSITDSLLAEVRASTNHDDLEALEVIVEDYYRSSLDELTGVYVITISPWNNVYTSSYKKYLDDPWAGKVAFRGQTGCYYFIVDEHGEVTFADAEAAGKALYDAAKAEAFSPIPELNNVSGFIVSFEELRGSIPEFMREVFERKEWDVHARTDRQPNVEKLLEAYNRERDNLLSYMRCDEKRVLRDSMWLNEPVTKLTVCFNRFDSCNMASPVAKPAHEQATAFFSVSDNSPEFKPDESYKWYGETSRWLYAGSIAIDYYCDKETGEERVAISTHH